ncbi:L,D-transpeptidase [Frigidibacter sp. MR17.14]|uniref:L,D-transpeptidase n=1 Tax=Frigidibacter sp. MR17.14 TaxID=3126509 RepID=UPI003012E5CE
MIPIRPLAGLLALALLGACAAPLPTETPDPGPQVSPEVKSMYGAREDGGFAVPAVPDNFLTDHNVRQTIGFVTAEKPGTVVVDPWQRYLYFILPEGQAVRYGVAVGDEGRAFAGEAHIPYMRHWPSWRPTQNMIREFPETYARLADGMDGGVWNPLGARALYLHQGNRDTYYRIHGTSDMGSIGSATSAGCIRMFHQDVIDLGDRVKSMTRVVVLTPEQSRQSILDNGGFPDPVQAPAIASQVAPRQETNA